MQYQNGESGPSQRGGLAGPAGAEAPPGPNSPEEEVGPGEEAGTPEEEALGDKAVDSLREVIHDQKAGDVEKDLKTNDGPLYQRVSDIAYPLVMNMAMSAKGQALDIEFWMNVGVVAVEELFAVAEAMNMPEAADEQEKEAALLDMVVRYGEENQDNPEAQAAAQEAAAELANSGQVEEAMALMGGGQDPMAQAVSQGVQQGPPQSPPMPGGVA